MIPVGQKISGLLYSRGISTNQFERDTGIARRILYPSKYKPRRATLMAIAYYLDMRVEDLIAGTDAAPVFRGDAGI